ncbi:putative transcription factor kan4 [Quercus suber]|uniref:Transcription factor kan4 n=1 Tax=Quercus suber TaxID=58331 RepID=A0AAW0JXU2_QUESU
MFLSSNPIMRTTSSTTPSPLPDLSLQISPPSVSADFEAKEVSYDGLITRKAVIHSDRSSTTDSGSSGSDLSHENGGFYPAGAYNLGLTEPTSNTKVCVRVDECEGSNPSSREEPFAGGVNMYRTVKSTDKGSGLGQTDIGLKQRPGLVNVEGVLPCEKASPITTLEKTQSSQREDGHNIEAPHVNASDGAKERLDSSSMSPSNTLLNLEFTLGRPNWQMDYVESSTELALLKC